MAKGSNTLKLEVETDEGGSSFELVPGRAVVIGRAENVDLQIQRSSVSNEHLSILWTGKEVQLKDLGSKFGTFRMPQDSPFKEASFPPAYAPIELRLSKSKVRLSWSKSDFVSEPTEVVSGTQVKARSVPEELEKTRISAQAPPASTPSKEHSAIRPPPSPAAEPSSRTVNIAVPDLPKSVRVANSPFELQASVLALVASFVWFVGWSMGWFAYFGGLARVPALWLVNGGMLDITALWMHGLRTLAPLIPLFALAWIFVLRRLRHQVREGKIVFLKNLQRLAPARWVALNRILSVTLWLMGFLAPGLWAANYGIKPAQWASALRLYQATVRSPAPDMDVKDIQSKVQELKALKKKFVGSSLLYRSLFGYQRLRVLKECGGVGEAPWDSKKVCLVLLFAVSIETREEVRPALLQDISARVAILLSLDGITRVLAAEGSEASMIPFFLESLEMVGLAAEREDIQKILNDASGPKGPKGTIDTLKELRRRIEILLEARQRELAYPQSFRLSVPGPLESGI